MSIVNPNSLAETLDAINEALFFGIPLSLCQKEEIALWIANRQGLPGSYAGMFAPTEYDFRKGARLFTGEQIKSRGGSGHILGEEACRALICLNVPLAKVQEALHRASQGMMSRLGPPVPPGTYCCGTCSDAFWRHLAAGGLEDAEVRLSYGLKTLQSRRNGQGRWRAFPFHYTLLVLSEIDLPGAAEEMRYAAPVLERYLKRSPIDNETSRRRRLLAERVLAKC